jgi:hypothetical protein
MEERKVLSEIKKQYEPLRKKYKLLSFDDMNKEFEIEKVQERETDFLLREVRRAVSEKIVAFLKFLELFMNPASAPLFVLLSLKNIGPDQKEKIEELYKELVEIELSSVALDLDYKEIEEAKFILRVVKRWKEVKKDLTSVFSEIEKIHSKDLDKKTKNYYG